MERNKKVQENSVPAEDLYAEPCVRCGEVTHAFCEGCPSQTSAPPFAICTSCDEDELLCHQCEVVNKTWKESRRANEEAFGDHPTATGLIQEDGQCQRETPAQKPRTPNPLFTERKPIKYAKNRVDGVLVVNDDTVHELLQQVETWQWVGILTTEIPTSQQTNTRVSATSSGSGETQQTWQNDETRNIYCKICELWLQDPDQWTSHCRGRMHSKNMETHQRQGAEQSGAATGHLGHN